MYQRKGKVLWVTVLGIAMLALGVFTGVEAEGRKDRQSSVVVVAHRAGAARAPENTVAALEQAIADGAAMVEVDVQQLKDGTLIVMHDSNFKRTAGVDRNVWDVDYQELRSLAAEAVSGGSPENEGIPTLEELLQCADGRICLMLELKYTGQELELEEAVLGLLKQYRMERSCIIGSMNSGVLQHMKELDPELTTVFIVHDLTEEQYLLDYADSYSIQARNLNPELVERLHTQNKPVYAWTVNDRHLLQWAVDCGADGIVTDNVPGIRRFLQGSFYPVL